VNQIEDSEFIDEGSQRKFVKVNIELKSREIFLGFFSEYSIQIVGFIIFVSVTGFADLLFTFKIFV
jgi:hypothetical protein